MDGAALREQADRARQRGEHEAQHSEYPRVGKWANNHLAETLEAMAQAIETETVPDGDSEYAKRRAARLDRLRRRAAKLRLESAQLSVASHNATAGIPFGQPILVGHHSEGRHRRAIERAQNLCRKSCATWEAAKRADSRADGCENRDAIDSDDPDAPDLLRAKISELEIRRDTMKAHNAAYRKAKGDLARMVLDDATRASYEREKARWFMGPENWQPWPAYSLSNLGKNLKRYKDRLAEVEALGEMGDVPDKTENGVTLSIDQRAGRVYFFTPGKNEKATELLRRRGWVWARSAGAWSRKITANAVVVARRLFPEVCAVYAE